MINDIYEISKLDTESCFVSVFLKTGEYDKLEAVNSKTHKACTHETSHILKILDEYKNDIIIPGNTMHIIYEEPHIPLYQRLPLSTYLNIFNKEIYDIKDMPKMYIISQSVVKRKRPIVELLIISINKFKVLYGEQKYTSSRGIIKTGDKEVKYYLFHISEIL